MVNLRLRFTVSMPPLTWWLRGRAEVQKVLLASEACRGDRMVPVVANGSPAFGQYRLDGPEGAHAPFALVIVTDTDEFRRV